MKQQQTYTIFWLVPILKQIFKTAILKYNVSDHLSIWLIILSLNFSWKNSQLYKETFWNWLARNWNFTKSTWNLIFFPLKQFKIKSKDYLDNLGLPMALKNLLNVSSVFIINFLKIEMKKNKNETEYKFIRIYLKLLKSVPKRTTFQN